MRTLQFSANCTKHSQVDHVNHATQEYVATLLSKKLTTYGFETQHSTSAEKVEVRVAENPLAITVECDLADENGYMICRINAHAEEQQPWFKKIETQSMIKQLAHAVENTLKDDDAFSEFKWHG